MAAIQGQCAQTTLKSKAFLGDASFAGARRVPVQQRGSLQVPVGTNTLGAVSDTYICSRRLLAEGSAVVNVEANCSAWLQHWSYDLTRTSFSTGAVSSRQ